MQRILFVSILILAQPSTAPAEESASANLEELLTYGCAREVAAMLEGPEQRGPLFARDHLVFTSIEAQDGSIELVLSAGAGTYVVPLGHRGVNRIHFEMPTLTSTREATFYLTYLHDTNVRSRVFEFSEGHAPPGKSELDYVLVEARRATNLEPHLEYAIMETSTGVLNLVLEGVIKRGQLSFRQSDCEHLVRRSAAVAQHIRRNLDEIEMMVNGPLKKPAGGGGGARMPASVTAAALPFGR